MLSGFIMGILGFVGYFAVVVLSLRIWATKAAAVAILSALAVYPVSLVIFPLAGQTVMFLPVSATYWCFTLIFLMAFGAIYKSISLRILGDLLGQPGYVENYDAVLRRYVASESFEHRLGVMQSSGFATCQDGYFRLTPKGRAVAFFARSIQRMFGIERSG